MGEDKGNSYLKIVFAAVVTAAFGGTAPWWWPSGANKVASVDAPQLGESQLQPATRGNIPPEKTIVSSVAPVTSSQTFTATSKPAETRPTVTPAAPLSTEPSIHSSDSDCGPPDAFFGATAKVLGRVGIHEPSEAIFNRGIWHEYGQRGFTQDDRAAVQCYARAAGMGSAGAENSLGHMYRAGKGGLKADPAKAVFLWKESAAQGYAYAQANLGDAYFTGLGGLPKSETDALGWYMKAAEQGEMHAIAQVGYMYREGAVLRQDDVEAVRWFMRAAEQGDANGQMYLAQMYACGRGGLPQDPAKATELFDKADKAGATAAKWWAGAINLNHNCRRI